MPEDERGGQPQPGGRGEPVAQLDGGQRIEAQILERGVAVHRPGIGVPQHRGRLGAYQVEQFAVLFGKESHQKSTPLGSRRLRGSLPIRLL